MVYLSAPYPARSPHGHLAVGLVGAVAGADCLDELCEVAVSASFAEEVLCVFTVPPSRFSEGGDDLLEILLLHPGAWDCR